MIERGKCKSDLVDDTPSDPRRCDNNCQTKGCYFHPDMDTKGRGLDIDSPIAIPEFIRRFGCGKYLFPSPNPALQWRLVECALQPVYQYRVSIPSKAFPSIVRKKLAINDLDLGGGDGFTRLNFELQNGDIIQVIRGDSGLNIADCRKSCPKTETTYLVDALEKIVADCGIYRWEFRKGYKQKRGPTIQDHFTIFFVGGGGGPSTEFEYRVLSLIDTMRCNPIPHPSREDLIKFARFTQKFYKEGQEIMRAHNLCIDSLDDDMQKLAFTFYSNLCEIDSEARHLFQESYGEENYHDERLPAGETYSPEHDTKIREEAIADFDKEIMRKEEWTRLELLAIIAQQRSKIAQRSKGEKPCQ